MIVVIVPSTVSHHWLERDPCTTCESNGTLRDEYGFARLIAPARVVVGRPCCFKFAIDRHVNRTDHPFILFLIFFPQIIRLRPSDWINVGRRSNEFNFRAILWLINRRHKNFHLGQCCRSTT